LHHLCKRRSGGEWTTGKKWDQWKIDYLKRDLDPTFHVDCVSKLQNNYKIIFRVTMAFLIYILHSILLHSQENSSVFVFCILLSCYWLLKSILMNTSEVRENKKEFGLRSKATPNPNRQCPFCRKYTIAWQNMSKFPTVGGVRTMHLSLLNA